MILQQVYAQLSVKAALPVTRSLRLGSGQREGEGSHPWQRQHDHDCTRPPRPTASRGLNSSEPDSFTRHYDRQAHEPNYNEEVRKEN